MKTLTFTLQLLLAYILYPSLSYASCERHLYNNLPTAITVQTSGSVTCGSNNTTCVIGPNSSGLMYYRSFSGSGHFKITDNFPSHAVFGDGVGFDVDKCHIIHSGDTGNVALNDPAEGDIKTCGSNGYQCSINTSKWDPKPIETLFNPGSTCDQSIGNSCWITEDVKAYRLDVNNVDRITELKQGGSFPTQNHRFIFVYRKNDNKLVIRPYDRSDRFDQYPDLTGTPEYADNRFYRNFRNNKYLHVRHSQLNNGWNPVWCAGEMTTLDGKLWRLNNASGHFKPDVKCLSYVEDVLKLYGFPIHPNFRSGAYSSVSAAEQNPPSTIPDDDDPKDQL